MLNSNHNPKKTIATKLTFTESHNQLQKFLDKREHDQNISQSFSSSPLSSNESLSSSIKEESSKMQENNKSANLINLILPCVETSKSYISMTPSIGSR